MITSLPLPFPRYHVGSYIHVPLARVYGAHSTGTAVLLPIKYLKMSRFDEKAF